jgi:hypothetical protein
MPNTQVVNEIRARCGRDSRLDHPTEMAVSERAGKVTLRGTVRSLRQRRAAVDIAKSTRGVRAAADELIVDEAVPEGMASGMLPPARTEFFVIIDNIISSVLWSRL